MYFPKNKIKTGLYANKGEFFYLDTFAPYDGFYYSLYNGKFFEGKSPTKDNKEIIPSSKINQITNTSTLGVPQESPGYSEVNNTAYIIPTGETQIVPIFYYPQPTEQDYQTGQFLRYFCKKTNESKFLEINKTDYEGLINKDPKYVYSLYQPFYLFWYITGDNRKEIVTINKRVAIRYEKVLQLPGLDRFIESIGGYDKFYK